MVLNRLPICFCITACFSEESSVVQKKEVNSSLELVLGRLLSSGLIITAHSFVAKSYGFSLLIYWLKRLWRMYKNRRTNLLSYSCGIFMSYPFSTKKERWIGVFVGGLVGVFLFGFFLVKPLTRISLTAEILYSFVPIEETPPEGHCLVSTILFTGIFITSEWCLTFVGENEERSIIQALKCFT